MKQSWMHQFGSVDVPEARDLGKRLIFGLASSGPRHGLTQFKQAITEEKRRLEVGEQMRISLS